MNTISYILSAVSFIVGILVLIKLFKREGILKGILGLICMLYTFIWGWMHAKDENISTLMIVWTSVIIISIIISIIVSSSAGFGSGEEAWLSVLTV